MSNKVFKKVLLTFILFVSSGVSTFAWKAQHVILIGIDGWGAYSVPKATNIPNIRYLMEQGCYTLHERSVLPSSSAINWQSMFGGAGPEMHGYTQWNSQTPEIPSMVVNKHGHWPTVFSILREQRPDANIACMAEWDGIKYLVDSLSCDNFDIATGYEKQPTQLCDMATAYIKAHKPTLMGICFDQLDHTGHAIGHDTPAYYKTLSEIDGYIGKIIQALKDAGIYDKSVIIVTADHGGKGTGHGGKTLLEMEIPFIIYGDHICQGKQITDVVMQFDTAATIAYALGLKRPQAWIGRPVMSAFK